MGFFRDIVDGLFGREREKTLGIPPPMDMRRMRRIGEDVCRRDPELGEELKEIMEPGSGCICIDENGQFVEFTDDPSERGE